MCHITPFALDVIEINGEARTIQVHAYPTDDGCIQAIGSCGPIYCDGEFPPDSPHEEVVSWTRWQLSKTFAERAQAKAEADA